MASLLNPVILAKLRPNHLFFSNISLNNIFIFYSLYILI